MGINKQNQIQDYWYTLKNVPSHPMVYKSISLNWFEQLQQYIHVFDPKKEGPAYVKVNILDLIHINNQTNNK